LLLFNENAISKVKRKSNPEINIINPVE